MNANGSGEEVADAAAPAATGKAAAAAKRKNLMTNIKSRMNVNGYNAAVQGKKNEKELAAKVKFFEKKQADGTFKEYMRPRMEEAKTLLERVRTLRATPLVARPPAAAEEAVAPPLKAPRPAAKTKKVAKAAAAAGNAAAANGAPKAAEKPKTLRAKTPKPPKAAPALAPIAENENENQNYSASNFVENNQGVNTFLRKEAARALPLPVLHDPYTGKKFKPEEDPMPPIKKAYKMLKKLRKNVYARAETQRSIARAKLGLSAASGSTRRTRRSKGRK
jgi:hypothetical protein